MLRGVAVEQEAVDDVAFLQACAHHVVGDGVGNQVAGVDVRLRFLAQLSLFLDVLAEDITGGNRGNLQRFSNLDGWVPLPAPGGPTMSRRFIGAVLRSFVVGAER